MYLLCAIITYFMLYTPYQLYHTHASRLKCISQPTTLLITDYITSVCVMMTKQLMPLKIILVSIPYTQAVHMS